MSILFTYSPWFLLLCVFLGVSYAYLLYRFDPRTRDFPFWLNRTLAVIRFVAVSLIAFFLLEPLIRTTDKRVEEPIVVIAQDDSASIPLSGDSTYYKKKYPEELRGLVDQLEADHRVRVFKFGKGLEDGLDPGFEKKETDLSMMMDGIRDRFSDRNLGAVILASDGLYNTGRDPRYTAGKLRTPVYTIALGDTTIRKDLILKDVAHNRLAYLGNKFPLEMIVDARRCKGEETELLIRKDGKELFSKTLSFEQKKTIKVVPAKLTASEVGLQRYHIELKALDGEANLGNNSRDIFIDVLDSRREVLILGQAPHPDIRALRLGVESNNSYEVRSELIDEFNGETEDLSLVVFHQLPTPGNGVGELVKKLRDQGVPQFFILGSKTKLTDLDELDIGLNIQSTRNRIDEAKPLYNKEFSFFKVSDATRKASKEWPPLSVPFGDWKVSEGMETLFRKRIGMVKTEEPLVGFIQEGDRKSGVIAGEGLWRWRLNNAAQNGKVEAFNEVMTKIVQYLAVKEDKSRFRVEGETDIKENEPIVFRAELYNRSYELINEPEVTMTIRDKEGKEYPFSFSRTADAYRLDAGRFPVGQYTYTATTELEGKKFTEKGSFSISPVKLEQSRTVADHQLLYELSRRTGGDMVYPTDMKDLPSRIREKGTVKPVTYTQESLTDLIHLNWLFFVILALLSFEWFMRKRYGAY